MFAMRAAEALIKAFQQPAGICLRERTVVQRLLDAVTHLDGVHGLDRNLNFLGGHTSFIGQTLKRFAIPQHGNNS